MYDGHSGILPRNVQKALCKLDENKRNSRVFRIQFARTRARQQSALVYGAKLFNGLDKNVRDANNKHSLKKRFKEDCFLLYFVS